jgi:hypothetical protein
MQSREEGDDAHVTHCKNDTWRSEQRQRTHSRRRLRQRRLALAAAICLAGPALASCSAEAIFTSGRVSEPCSAVYPTCHAGFSAGCYLNSEKYTEGTFPGARRFLVATSQVNQVIRVGLLLTEMLYPGTEILVQAYEPDCGDVTQDLRQDIDVFEEAGDDAKLLFDLEAETPGDHLVELYSDCASDYLLTAESYTPEE